MKSTTVDEVLARLAPLFINEPLSVPWRSNELRFGNHPSHARGTGSEFCDFRPYRIGDNLRRLNWKLYARNKRQPLVNVFEEDRQVLVRVLIDVSATTAYGSQELTKRGLTAVLAGSIIRSATASHDQVSLVTYSVDGVHNWAPRASAHTQMVPMMINLAREGKPERSGASLCEALKFDVERRTLTFIISDFCQTSNAEAEALAIAGSQHDVICLYVQDPLERQLPETKLFGYNVPSLYRFVDSRGHQRWVDTTTRSREQYATAFKDHETLIRAILTKARCACGVFSTEETVQHRSHRLTRIFRGLRGEHLLPNQHPV